MGEDICQNRREQVPCMGTTVGARQTGFRYDFASDDLYLGEKNPGEGAEEQKSTARFDQDRDRSIRCRPCPSRQERYRSRD